MTTFMLEELAPHSAAAIRAEVPLAELTTVFDRGFREVMAAVARQGRSVTGPPFGYYPRTPGPTVEVVVGFPVSGPVQPDGEVEPFELPGGQVISGTHVGPYDRLEETYRELAAWASAQGLELADHMWESYLSDPSTQPDPATWTTSIIWPVA